MSRPAVPPPIQPPRPQHQPPAPKPVNMGLIAGMVIVAFAVTGIAIWAGIEQQRKLAGPASAGVDDPKRREILIAAGHDPDEDFPLWPLVYDDGYEAVMEGDRLVIKGTMTNHGSDSYDFIAVEMALYNSEGHKIGTSYDSMTNLGPGETWGYKVTPSQTGWKSFKIVDIRAR